MRCFICDGNGMRPCQACDEKGWVATPNGPDGFDETDCPACDGKIDVECDHCDGGGACDAQPDCADCDDVAKSERDNAHSHPKDW